MIGKFLSQLSEKIEPLKKKLPFSKSDDEYEEYEEDEEDEEEYEDDEDGVSDDTQEIEVDPSKLKDLGDDEEEDGDDDDDDGEEDGDDDDDDDDDDEEESELSEEEAKKKKKKQIIHAVLALALIFFAVDEFMGTDESTGDEVVTTAKPKVKRKKRKNRKAKKRPARNKVTKAKSDKKINEKKAEEVKKIVEKEPVKKVEQPTKVEPKPKEEKKLEEVQKNETKLVEKPSQEKNSKEKTVTKEVIGKPNEVTSSENKLNEQLNKIIQKVEEDKEMKKAKEASPPDYEEFGRGLVYNCKGKHWACLNKKAFFTCRDNMKWNTQENKSSECMTVEVYESEKDCRQIQLHKINTVAKVPDCK